MRISDWSSDVCSFRSPAYKGIPLATALACEYARRGRDLPVAFNRKEAKDHGEGGHLIGAPLAGRRVLVVDDVFTAGTDIGRASWSERVGTDLSFSVVAVSLKQKEASKSLAYDNGSILP